MLLIIYWLLSQSRRDARGCNNFFPLRLCVIAVICSWGSALTDSCRKPKMKYICNLVNEKGD